MRPGCVAKEAKKEKKLKDLKSRISRSRDQRSRLHGDVTWAEIGKITYNLGTDCSISVKFGNGFDHVTPDILQSFKVKAKTSSYHQIIVFFFFGGGGESGLLIGRCEISVCTHAQYKNSPERQA